MRPRRRPTRPLVAALTAGSLLLLAACGDDETQSSSTADSVDDSVVDDVELVPGASTTTTAAPDVPAVSIPAELPTELVVTDLVTGTGPAAKAGDVVFVDYVGVRSEDGEQFDTSYGREPFELTLGAGSVIKGWDEGLVGVQAGGRRQLDIPADLAYGDQAPPGGTIRPGDALTFVVDVRAVIPAATAAEAPTDVEVPTSSGATETTSQDVVVGEGAELTAGGTGIVRLLLYRGDNGALLYNSWDGGEPLRVQLVDGATMPGLITGLDGMRVGGRRILIIPPADAFGEGGDPQLGLPAGSDLVIVADLLAAL